MNALSRSTSRVPEERLARKSKGLISGFERLAMGVRLSRVSALLLSIGLTATAHAIEWTIRVTDAACLHEYAEKYRRDLGSPMLIFPRRCPDTLANPLSDALQAQAPEIQTAPEDEPDGTDDWIVLDESEFDCLLRLYEEASGEAGQPDRVGGDEEETMTFDMDKCPTAE